MFAEGRQRRIEQAGVAVYSSCVALGDRSAARAPPAPPRRCWSCCSPAVVVCVAAVVGYGVPRLRHGFEIPLLVLAAARSLGCDRLRGRDAGPRAAGVRFWRALALAALAAGGSAAYTPGDRRSRAAAR